MSEIRVGVIGIGNMGTAHAACLHEGRIDGMRLTAVCDLRAERLEECARRFPEAERFEDYRAMIHSGLVDAVIVAVPHPLHSDAAMAALDAGLHALTEKPIDVRVSKARQLCDAAKRSGKVFAIMLNQRTNPLFRRAREIVQSGRLGALKRTVWIITNWYRTQFYYDSGSWRATWAGEGGGVLLNQAPHNLDLWQWICGMPEEVTAFCDVAKYHRIEVEDDATIFTRYANGATGAFMTSTGEYPGTNRLEISGELGKLVLENGAMKWWKLRRPEPQVRFESKESFDAIPMDVEEITTDEPETAHAGILQNFANAILHGEALISPGEDGLSELTLSNAAYLSQWTGNRPIRLPMDEAAFDRELAARAEKSAFHDGGEAHPDGKYSVRWQVKW